MAKILILIGGHLCTAPRPQKEAAAGKAAGFDVVIRGVWWNEVFAKEDLELARDLGAEFAPVIDLQKTSLAGKFFRAKQRFAKELYQRFGIASSRTFGVAAPEMLREAMQVAPDLTMVHSEAGLWVGRELLNRGFRVGVDFEDWFSEDLPIQDRKGRPVSGIKSLEQDLLRRADPVLTTTKIMATTMAADAGCERVPEMIPNCFPWAKAPSKDHNPDKRDREAISFYWFSQTIGPGRGLETLAAVLQRLNGNWQLHLRGEIRNHGTWFETTFAPAIRERIMLHGTVPNSELASCSASHDVGLALEESHCPSRDLTATNKIFEYLRCGLAVIATATSGQIEVMEGCPEAGWVVPSGNLEALAAVMQRCLDDRGAVKAAGNAAARGASERWAWETYAPRLESLLKQGASGR